MKQHSQDVPAPPRVGAENSPTAELSAGCSGATPRAADSLLVMPSNNTGIEIGRLVGMYPGRLGHLFSPDGLRQTYDWMPFALDNGKYACWSSGKQWHEKTKGHK